MKLYWCDVWFELAESPCCCEGLTLCYEVDRAEVMAAYKLAGPEMALKLLYPEITHRWLSYQKEKAQCG